MVSSSRLARLLQLQVSPSGASFLAISRARGKLAVKVSSSKKNSRTCGKSFFMYAISAATFSAERTRYL